MPGSDSPTESYTDRLLSRAACSPVFLHLRAPLVTVKWGYFTLSAQSPKVFWGGVAGRGKFVDHALIFLHYLRVGESARLPLCWGEIIESPVLTQNGEFRPQTIEGKFLISKNWILGENMGRAYFLAQVSYTTGFDESTKKQLMHGRLLNLNLH